MLLYGIVDFFARPICDLCLNLEREKFAVVSTFLRKQLQLSDLAPLFVYVNSAFAPTPGMRGRFSKGGSTFEAKKGLNLHNYHSCV
jgi:hypothetical protein